MKEKTIEIMFLEEALGTSSANPDIHGEFIASKAPDAIHHLKCGYPSSFYMWLEQEATV